MIDPCTDYAQKVVGGEIVAGPYVRAACKRHLDDLENGHKRGLSWHPEEVERVIGYFREVLTVEIEREEDGETISEAVPFDPHPSQCFILGSLFGWRNSKGHRRFRRAYIEIGKGNGKSPLAAGIGHYMLSATKKLRAEIYSAATDKDQAAILFRDAVEMWNRSPALAKRLTPSGVNPVWQLTHIPSASFFKPISSEKKGKSGIRPYCALVDEVHEHPDNTVIEMLRAGTKGNQQALIFEITNSGFDRTSACWNEHEYTVKVVTGELENDSWFGYVCALDEGDKPFEDESCWIKANPLMGVSIHPEFIREQVREAEGMPSKESLVKRLHFCEWLDGAESWISGKLWRSRERVLNIKDFIGMECYGGIDLSYTKDLSALAIVFPKDGKFYAFVYLWKPKETLEDAEKEDRVPYRDWANQGHLITTPGKVIKLPKVARKLGEIQTKFQFLELAYDKYRQRELDEDLQDEGISLNMIEHPQGFRRDKNSPLWMPESVETLENMITEGELVVNTNPLLRYNVASAVVRPDPAGTDGRILDKRKSRARIDGAVALAMGVGIAKVRHDSSKRVLPVNVEDILV